MIQSTPCFSDLVSRGLHGDQLAVVWIAPQFLDNLFAQHPSIGGVGDVAGVQQAGPQEQQG